VLVPVTIRHMLARKLIFKIAGKDLTRAAGVVSLKGKKKGVSWNLVARERDAEGEHIHFLYNPSGSYRKVG